MRSAILAAAILFTASAASAQSLGFNPTPTCSAYTGGQKITTYTVFAANAQANTAFTVAIYSQTGTLLGTHNHVTTQDTTMGGVEQIGTAQTPYFFVTNVPAVTIQIFSIPLIPVEAPVQRNY